MSHVTTSPPYWNFLFTMFYWENILSYIIVNSMLCTFLKYDVYLYMYLLTMIILHIFLCTGRYIMWTLKFLHLWHFTKLVHFFSISVMMSLVWIWIDNQQNLLMDYRHWCHSKVNQSHAELNIMPSFGLVISNLVYFWCYDFVDNNVIFSVYMGP